MRSVLHIQIPTAFQFYKLTTVGAQIGTKAYGIVYMHGHNHIHTAQRHGRGLIRTHRGRVRKGSKGNQAFKTVFHRQRRVGEHIGHIRISQQIHIAAHGQGIQRPSYRCVQIDKYLAVNETFAGTRRIQQRIVLCQQFQIRRRAFQITKIHLTVNGERILTGGIDSELIEYQLIVLNLYGAVVEPVAGSCLTRIYRYAVQCNISVHLGFLQRSVDIHSAVKIAGEGNHLVGNKGIGNLHREMLKRGGHFQRIPAILLRQYTVCGQHFLIVVTEIRIQIMRSAFISRQPCGAHTDVSYMLPLVSQFIDAGFGRHL